MSETIVQYCSGRMHICFQQGGPTTEEGLSPLTDDDVGKLYGATEEPMLRGQRNDVNVNVTFSGNTQLTDEQWLDLFLHVRDDPLVQRVVQASIDLIVLLLESTFVVTIRFFGSKKAGNAAKDRANQLPPINETNDDFELDNDCSQTMARLAAATPKRK